MKLQLKFTLYITCVVFAGITTLFTSQTRRNCEKAPTNEPREYNEKIYGTELSPGTIPELASHPRKVAYVMWCGNRTFNFVNYMSILSTIHFMRPEKLYFQYSYLPVVDSLYYNTWFEELQESVGTLELDHVSTMDRICSTEYSRMAHMMNTISKFGGVYIDTGTIFIHYLTGPHTDNLLSSHYGYVIHRSKSQIVEANSVCRLSIHRQKPSTNLNTSLCICEVDDNVHINPRDYWMRGDKYGAVVRMLMYGDSKMPQPISRMEDLIPNIAHVMWIGGRPVDLLFYLCCLSLLYIVGVEHLYVHGEVSPFGLYWDKVKDIDRVQFIPREIPNFILNQRAFTVPLMTDIFRSEVMLNYGGIYSDVDVIWTRPLNTQIRSYDAVASLDWAPAYYPYPDHVNLAVCLGKRNAPFWRQFRQSFRNLREELLGFNGHLQPYKMYERNPTLLHIEDTLQITCSGDTCNQANWKLYQKTTDWQTGAYAFHWNWPIPDEYSDMKTLLQSHTVWAQIGQHVLRKAGLL